MLALLVEEQLSCSHRSNATPATPAIWGKTEAREGSRETVRGDAGSGTGGAIGGGSRSMSMPLVCW